MKNMGSLDQIIRLLVVLAIAAAYAMGTIGGPLAIALGVLALVLMLTILTATCPAYRLLGMSTRPKFAEPLLP